MFLLRRRRELLGSEVLQETFRWLQFRPHSIGTIICNRIEGFSAGAVAEIASDGKGTHPGFMCYDTLELCRFGERVWVVGFGRKGGGYPGNEFAGDLMAFVPQTSVPSDLESSENGDFEKQIAAEVWRRNCRFRSSLLVAYGDGGLYHRDQGLAERIAPHLDRFVTGVRMELAGFELNTPKPIFGAVQLFSWKFPRFLAAEIVEYLPTRPEYQQEETHDRTAAHHPRARNKKGNRARMPNS